MVKQLLNEDDCLLFLVDYVSQPVRILAANLYWLSCAKCDSDLIDVLHAIWDAISKAKSFLHLSILQGMIIVTNCNATVAQLRRT